MRASDQGDICRKTDPNADFSRFFAVVFTEYIGGKEYATEHDVTSGKVEPEQFDVFCFEDVGEDGCNGNPCKDTSFAEQFLCGKKQSEGYYDFDDKVQMIHVGSRPGMEELDREMEDHLLALRKTVDSANGTECEQQMKLLKRVYLRREEQAKSS